MSLQQVQTSDDTNGQIISMDLEEAVQYRKMSTEEIEALKQRVDSVKKEFEDHKYKLDVDQEMMHSYVDFIVNEAKFDGKDCIGLPRIHDALQECIKEGNSMVMGGKPQYTITNMHLEALYYYLTKSVGTGLQEATRITNMLNPILECLSRAVVRRNTLQSFLEKAEAQLHGIISPDEKIDPEYEENV
jgi:exonuclease VII small subunit